MRYFYLTVLILSAGAVQAGLFVNLKDDVLKIWEERQAQRKAAAKEDFTREKRTYRKFNNAEDLAKTKGHDENSTNVGTAKVKHNRVDAALPPNFRKAIDNDTGLLLKDHKLTRNKTIIFKSNQVSDHTKDTSISKDSHVKQAVTLSSLNDSKEFAAEAEFEIENITNGSKKERRFKIVHIRKPQLSSQNESRNPSKEKVTKTFPKVNLKLENNKIYTKNNDTNKTGGIFKEKIKSQSKIYHNISSIQNNTALEKGKALEKHMDMKKHNMTNKHKKGAPEFRGRKSSGDTSSSTDLEKMTWMEDFNEHWMQKKFEALNSTLPRGDVINMVAARPWGVSCGDPNQHDTPWGSCTLPGECEPEYRIYRGDYACGRTSFVCCALLKTAYDMYQGLDVSLEEDSSATTDTSQDKNDLNSEALAHRKHRIERIKQRKERLKRRKLLRKNLKRIVTAFKHTLNMAYMNRSVEKRRRVHQLIDFIKKMKNELSKDSKTLVRIHHIDMTKMDEKLFAKLSQLKSVNKDLMRNDTFRNIVTHGKVDKNELKHFIRSNPLFAKYIKRKRRSGIKRKRKNVERVKHVKRANKRKSKKRKLKKKNIQKQNSRKRSHVHQRRSGVGLNLGLDEGEQHLETVEPQDFDYDIEYGVLYY